MDNKDIVALIENDRWMTRVLSVVKGLNLPDWWIGAGFVRSKVWDHLHRYKKRTPLPDIDVIFFDKNSPIEKESKYEKLLKNKLPKINWSVKNQARMHLFHNDKPYNSSEEALSKWVETATCIGAKLDKDNRVILCAPWGVKDLVSLVLRPTLKTSKNLAAFKSRIENKQWLTKWPKLKTVL